MAEIRSIRSRLRRLNARAISAAWRDGASATVHDLGQENIVTGTLDYPSCAEAIGAYVDYELGWSPTGRKELITHPRLNLPCVLRQIDRLNGPDLYVPLGPKDRLTGEQEDGFLSPGYALEAFELPADPAALESVWSCAAPDRSSLYLWSSEHDLATYFARLARLLALVKLHRVSEAEARSFDLYRPRTALW